MYNLDDKTLNVFQSLIGKQFRSIVLKKPIYGSPGGNIAMTFEQGAILEFEDVNLEIGFAWTEIESGEVFFDYEFDFSNTPLTEKASKESVYERIDKIILSIEIYGRRLPKEVVTDIDPANNSKTNDLFLFKFPDHTGQMIAFNMVAPGILFDSDPVSIEAQINYPHTGFPYSLVKRLT